MTVALSTPDRVKGQRCVIPLSLCKRLVQMFSHSMALTTSVWLTTIQITSKWID